MGTRDGAGALSHRANSSIGMVSLYNPGWHGGHHIDWVGQTFSVFFPLFWRHVLIYVTLTGPELDTLLRILVASKY